MFMWKEMFVNNLKQETKKIRGKKKTSYEAVEVCHFTKTKESFHNQVFVLRFHTTVFVRMKN